MTAKRVEVLVGTKSDLLEGPCAANSLKIQIPPRGEPGGDLLSCLPDDILLSILPSFFYSLFIVFVSSQYFVFLMLFEEILFLPISA